MHLLFGVVYNFAAANTGERWPCKEYKVCVQYDDDSKHILGVII